MAYDKAAVELFGAFARLNFKEDTMGKDYLATLNPEPRAIFQAFLYECVAQGLPMLVHSGLRSLEDQARLYRRSRSPLQVGHKVDELREAGFGFLADKLESVGPQPTGPWATNAAPGESWHNYGMAIDAVLLVDGKPDWNTNFMPKWHQVGGIAVKHGLEWAGNWKKSQEFVHFQAGKGNNPLNNLTPEQARKLLGV